MGISKTIALVSCVSEKTSLPQPAKQLYVSDWFIKASSYAQLVADEWFILSAMHHLVKPDQLIAPYDKTLKRMSKQERMLWARRVFADLRQILSPGDRAIILASNAYREFLLEPLRRYGVVVEIPLEGLRIGEQKQWLKKALGEKHGG
jgi:hypothetical protein